MMLCSDRSSSEASREVLITADRAPTQVWADRLTARLVPRGVRVRRASSGDEALEIVRGASLSMAVLDVRMPSTGGLRLLRRIRSVEPVMPCLLVADRISDRYLREALMLQATSVLSSPVDDEMLRELIADVFRRRYESDFEL